MFSHIMLGSNDLERSKRFYDALLVALGGEPGSTDAKGRLIYAHAGGRLMITRPIDGDVASAGNGTTIGFHAASPDVVEAWYDAGVADGGEGIEDPPGLRPNGLFLAYLRDPDGNKLCALHRPA